MLLSAVVGGERMHEVHGKPSSSIPSVVLVSVGASEGELEGIGLMVGVAVGFCEGDSEGGFVGEAEGEELGA